MAKLWQNRAETQNGLSQINDLTHWNYCGAGTRNRTRDTRIFSPLLYRLSYPGTLCALLFTEHSSLCQLIFSC